ncbi:MAG: hypothetical protein V7K39_17830 [Nostoc sp.]
MLTLLHICRRGFVKLLRQRREQSVEHEIASLFGKRNLPRWGWIVKSTGNSRETDANDEHQHKNSIAD